MEKPTSSPGCETGAASRPTSDKATQGLDGEAKVLQEFQESDGSMWRCGCKR